MFVKELFVTYLNDLMESYAVLIVDGEGKLTGIVTSADTTEYFRRRAEDMMLVEDIETLLKDMILSAFTDESGELDKDALNGTVKGITARGKDLRDKFEKALDHYLHNHSVDAVEMNRRLANTAFDEGFAPKSNSKTFELLTLSEYIQLLTHDKCWQSVQPLFSLDRKAVFKLLDDVRITRNMLSHFRDEISSKQRKQLRFCAEWLARHRPPVLIGANLETTAQIQVDAVVEPGHGVDETKDEIDEEAIHIDEPLEASDSRYARLAVWLQNVALTENTKRLSFDQIKSIIGHQLPPSSKHRAWWANDQVGHSHSKLWLEVGWQVAEINLSEEQVIFTRIKERGKAFDEFYVELHQSLLEKAPFEIRLPKGGGMNYYVVSTLPRAGSRLGTLLFYFSRKRNFKAQFYLSTSDKEKNKRFYDYLFARKSEIEEELGAPLSWKRQDTSITSRISLEREGSVTDKDQWADLRNWAVDAMLRLQKTFSKYVEEFCDLP